jgi:hypothetical protein
VGRGGAGRVEAATQLSTPTKHREGRPIKALFKALLRLYASAIRRYSGSIKDEGQAAAAAAEEECYKKNSFILCVLHALEGALPC